MKKVLFFLILALSFAQLYAQQTSLGSYSPNYLQLANKNNNFKKLTNLYCKNCYAVDSFLRQHNFFIKGNNKANNQLTAMVDRVTVEYLTQQNWVEFVDEPSTAQTEIFTLGFEKRFNGIAELLNKYPLLNGNGITVSVKEKNIDVSDLDVIKRVLPSTLKDNNIDDHATSMATLIGGAGNNAVSTKSIANAAKFYPTSFSNLFADADVNLTQNNVSVQNHSYGTLIQSFYGPEARSYDEQSFKNPSLLHVFSSGNFGNTVSTTGTYANLNGFANVSGNFKHAKNIITIAALDTTDNVTNFSSKGPLYDGRIAPQISALGANGTSDAAALVSGSAAILQQAYKNLFNSLPQASLVKALLFTGCNKNNIPALSYKYGFGKLDVVASINILQNNQFYAGSVAQNEIQNYNITIPPNCKRATITLCYTDTTSILNASTALVNNLDLQVLQGSNAYLPLLLNRAANVDSLNKAPITGVDNLNTTEQIVIENPIAANYTIRVIGKTISTLQRQAFAVAFKLDTANTFNFTFPLSSDDINIDEDTATYIQWKTANLGNAQLQVQFNNGAWQNVSTNINLALLKYRWTLPSFEGVIKYKMITSFGEFISPGIMLHKNLNIQTVFNCTDSAMINWPKYAFAQSYTVYSLIDSAYLQQFATTTDTSYIINKIQNSANFFAVEPVLSNGLKATRSILKNIYNQGVFCFYKQLLLQNTGNSNLIELQLSRVNDIQTIVFEKIVDGKVIVIKTLNSNIAESEFATDNNLSKGANTYRAKITLKNGRIVYTNEVSNIATGESKILVYPTVVKQAQLLQYLQNDAVIQRELCLYTVDGKFLQAVKIGLNGSLKTNNWPTGIIIYALREDGKQIDFGKIIVTP
jgi:Subtilase family